MKQHTLEHQIAIRLRDDTLQRLDDHLARMQHSLPSLRLTRSDALRDLMEAALRSAEAAAAAKTTSSPN